MIWIDTSFAVEWLLGMPRAKGLVDVQQPLGLLPMQYMETLIFFLKKGEELQIITNQLEPCRLFNPDNATLKLGARLYYQSRLQKSKASLADALLAAVCHQTKEKLLAFDNDFVSLRLKQQKEGYWIPSLFTQ